MKIITKRTLAALLTLALFALSGCNTVKGVGKDFEAMGESMQNAGD
jgi:predicted small secreted protein